MPVPNQTPYIIYNANGLTTVFSFEFYIINSSDIQVTINGDVVTSGYSVSGVGNVGGGDVIFVTPPANGSVVMLERVVPTYRLTDYQDNGDLLADTLNKDFDRLWMAIQRSFIHLGLALKRPLLGGPFDAQGYRIAGLSDPVNTQDAATKNYVDNVSLVRALRVPESFVPALPPTDQRANKLLAFNAEGNPIMVLPPSGSASDVLIELAKPTGGDLIGVVDPDGNATTVQNKLDSIDQRLTPVEDGLDFITPKEIYTIFDHAKQVSGLDYGAFCDGTVVGEFEYLIHREGRGHTDYNTPATSQLRIIKKDSYTGEITTFALISPLAGYDWRDPSITWFPITKKLVVTCATYDITNATWNRAIVQYYNLDGTIYFTSWLTAALTFQWGKAVETPAGFTLLSAYNADPAVTTQDSYVFRSNTTAGTETAYNRVATPFPQTVGMRFIEPSLHIWNNLLIMVCRCHSDPSGAGLVMRISYTKDLGGASGWSSVAVWPGLNYNGAGAGLVGVAPRFTTLPDGGLCLSAGFRKAATPPQRGSVACSTTYDMKNFTQFVVVYDGINPGLPNFGGYCGVYVRDDGYMGFYTFEEIAGSPGSADSASTYLAYKPWNEIKALVGSVVQRKMAASMYGSTACFGLPPVWNNLSVTGQYVYLTLKRPFDCKGIGFVAQEVASGSTLEITNTAGTLVATSSALSSALTTPVATTVNLTTATFLSQGVYRIRFVNGGVGVGRIGYFSNGAYSWDGVLPSQYSGEVLVGYLGYGDGTGIPQSSVNSTISIGLIHNS